MLNSHHLHIKLSLFYQTGDALSNTPVRSILDTAPRFEQRLSDLFSKIYKYFNITIYTTKIWHRMDYVKVLKNKYEGKHLTV